MNLIDNKVLLHICVVTTLCFMGNVACAIDATLAQHPATKYEYEVGGDKRVLDCSNNSWPNLVYVPSDDDGNYFIAYCRALASDDSEWSGVKYIDRTPDFKPLAYIDKCPLKFDTNAMTDESVACMPEDAVADADGNYTCDPVEKPVWCCTNGYVPTKSVTATSGVTPLCGRDTVNTGLSLCGGGCVPLLVAKGYITVMGKSYEHVPSTEGFAYKLTYTVTTGN